MRRTNQKQVTLFDIAQAGGLSLSAVSLALNDRPGVSPATRARVMELARTLGYQFKTPPPLAEPAPSPSRAIQTIGLLFSAGAAAPPDCTQSPDSTQSADCTQSPDYTQSPIHQSRYLRAFSAGIIPAVQAACRMMRLNCIPAPLDLDRDFRPLRLPPLLETGPVDGFLIAGFPLDDEISHGYEISRGCEISRMLDRRGLPVVLLETACPTRDYSAVLYDHFQAGFDAAEYLIGKGHRRIGCLGGHPQDAPALRQRRLGCLQALEARGLPLACADFPPHLPQPQAAAATSAAAAALALLRQDPSISALVCLAGEFAAAVIAGFDQAGICVPNDVSVIAFDDGDMPQSAPAAPSARRLPRLHRPTAASSATSASPALTTLRVSIPGMALLAVQMLLNQALPEDRDCVLTYFRPALVERASVIEGTGGV